MVEYLRALMQIKLSPKDSTTGDPSLRAGSSAGSSAGSGHGLTEAERLELAAHAEQMSMSQLSRSVRAFSNAINEMRATTDAQLPLEMAYLDCVVSDTAVHDSVSHEGKVEADAGRARTQARMANTASAPKSAEGKRSTSTRPEPLAESESVSSREDASARADTEPATQPTQNTAHGLAHADLSLDTLRSQWKQFVKEVDAQNKPAAALLRSCQLHDVSGGVVHIRANHDLFRSRLDDPKNKSSIVAVLNRMFDGKYDVRVFVNQAQQDIDPDEDPVVKAAKKLGGQVRT
jgi:DNA polymerase III gamma/tau subunit